MNLIKLDKAQKLKMLFLTENGKEIFEGDYVFFLPRCCVQAFQLSTYNGTGAAMKVEPCDVNFDGKIFSTKEAAEKYMDENKPIYSKKEIEDILIPYCMNSLLINLFNKSDND